LDGWSPFSPKVGGLDAEVRRVRVNLININCPKEETIKLVFAILSLASLNHGRQLLIGMAKLKHKYNDLGR
ncbi:MAG: hypothetical protein O4805_14465, partial [Trichodesmium sp. St16_bin2-tuft]|nr:hypothetical protein [Trichodesmium sp. St16_bin2-tuft]